MTSSSMPLPCTSFPCKTAQEAAATYRAQKGPLPASRRRWVPHDVEPRTPSQDPATLPRLRMRRAP